MRRIRASFLLRGVALVICVAAFVLCITTIRNWVVLSSLLAFMSIVWFIGIEEGLLPWLIERHAVRRAGASEKPVESIWFIDLEHEKQRAMDQFHEDTRDNPTLR